MAKKKSLSKTFSKIVKTAAASPTVRKAKAKSYKAERARRKNITKKKITGASASRRTNKNDQAR